MAAPTFGMCDNHKGRCPNFERPVPAQEGDTCASCGNQLLHESGLTWADAREKGYASAGPPKQRWYFTFGIGQPNAGHYYVVDNATFMDARAEMLAKFGRLWAFQYDEAEWNRDGVSQAEKYGLQEIAL